MILKLVRTPGIYIVGFMASGKTTIGRALADHLGWDFLDLDEAIEAEQHCTIADIFDRFGEEHFRALETEAIRKQVRRVRTGRPVVMAVGGGAFAREENFELLQENGVTVWLDCPLELARRRVAADCGRPLARDPVKFAALYEARRPVYSRADYRIEVTGDDPAAAVKAIAALPIFR